MKMPHLSILFVAVFVIILVLTDVRSDNMVALADAKTSMDYYLDEAIDSAIKTLKQMETNIMSVSDLDKVAESFFFSMYASLGILSSPSAQEKFRAYVPVISVTTDSGYFVMYNDEYKAEDGYSYVSRRWTELRPYYYQDENFIYRLTLTSDLSLYDKNNILNIADEEKVCKTTVEDIRVGDEYVSFRESMSGSFLLNPEAFSLIRQQAVISCLEKDLSYYISKHNEIASYYGITYQFGLPVADDLGLSKTIDGPGVVVVFQGRPLAEGSNTIYNRIAYSGAGMSRDRVFYIEQVSWYFLYHRAGCPKLEGNLSIREEHYYSVEECSKLGSYACEVCDPAGVHVPDY